MIPFASSLPCMVADDKWTRASSSRNFVTERRQTLTPALSASQANRAFTALRGPHTEYVEPSQFSQARMCPCVHPNP